MAIALTTAKRRAWICLISACILPAVSNAHVQLDSPNGGESLVVGATFEIQWHAQVQHDTLDWDLRYSTNSSSGPWLVISEDLPLGDPTAGVPHTFNWLVPDVFDTTVWVQVQQDNDAQGEYFDESDLSFGIVAAGDFDKNGNVDGDDLLLWQRNPSVGLLSDWEADYGVGGMLGSTLSTIPEPTTLGLLALGLVACGRLHFRNDLLV